MAGPAVTVTKILVTSNQACGDLLSPTFPREGGLPKLTVKEHSPIAIELVFMVNQALRLQFLMGTSKSSDGTPSDEVTHSYFELMGNFEPSETELRYTLKEYVPGVNNPFMKTATFRSTIKVLEAGGKELFSFPFFLSFRKTSLLSMIGHEIEGSQSSAKPSLQRKSSMRESQSERPASPSNGGHWSVVEKQQLPTESSKKITSLIEHDPSQPQDDQFRIDKRSTSETIKELGYWLYSTNVGQYFIKFHDEKARLGEVKDTFVLSPIWMLGTQYSFPDDEGADSDEEPKKSEGPRVLRISNLGERSKSDDPRRPRHKGRRSRSVSLPKKPRPVIQTIQRYGSLGDAYSIRELRRFPEVITLEDMTKISQVLYTYHFQPIWRNEANMEFEEHGKTSLVKNFVFIRFYGDPDPSKMETIVDFNFFANFKKTSLAFYLQPNPNLLAARAAKMLRILRKLTEILDAKLNKSEVLFMEGFNVDVSAQPAPIEDHEGLEEEARDAPPPAVPIRGALMLSDGPDHSKWTQRTAVLNDGVFSLSSPGSKEEGASIPIGMAAVRMTHSQMLIDIQFNEVVYHLRVDSERDFARWFHALKREAGLFDGDEEIRARKLSNGPVSGKAGDAAGERADSKERLNLTYDGDMVVISHDSQDQSEEPLHQEVLCDFLRNFQSRIWFTYRKDFCKIEPSNFASDVGWGCMLRTAQMLLAQAFVTSLLSREWRIHKRQSEEELAIYRHILLWFADNNELESYYSIHHMAVMGKKLDKKIGEWFGPCTAAYVLRRISAIHKGCPLTFYVNQDHAIYKDLITKQATADGTWRHVLILLPVRLGVEQLNPCYFEPLKRLFTIPQFLGIAGGKPCKSLYFVATQGDELFFLDPHVVKPYCEIQHQQLFPVESYHCDTVRSVHLDQIDPSMLLGFLIRSPEDLADFEARAASITQSPEPIFTIHDQAPKFVCTNYFEELSAIGLAKNLKK